MHCRLRRQTFFLPLGDRPAGHRPRPQAEPGRRQGSERGQHDYHAGDQAVPQQAPHHMAENDRNDTGHAAGVPVFQKRNTRAVCGQCPFRRKRSGPGSRFLALLRPQTGPAVLGGNRYPGRAAEQSCPDTPRPQPPGADGEEEFPAAKTLAERNDRQQHLRAVLHGTLT